MFWSVLLVGTHQRFNLQGKGTQEKGRVGSDLEVESKVEWYQKSGLVSH